MRGIVRRVHGSGFSRNTYPRGCPHRNYQPNISFADPGWVPFTERQARITEREVYTWNVVELCKVTLDSGLIGCESLPSPHACAPVLRSPRANAGWKPVYAKPPE